MNIEQYRAFKAQFEKEAQEETEQPKTQAETKPNTEETKTEQETQEAQKIEETKIPEKVELEIDGQKVEVDFNELKNGYLRQSDYTKKTQEVSKKSKELSDAVVLYEYLKKNPQIAKQIVESSQGANPTKAVDPVASKIAELEDTIANLMLEQEVVKLSSKYKDFNAMEVMNVARDKKVDNLEDAYHLWKGTKSDTGAPDIETLKQQIKADLLKEIEAEKSTNTIINAKGNPATTTTQTKLSPAESKVAKNMGLSDAEYIKWKNT